MKPLSSSKKPEKVSGEGRSKKKKIKTKSAKRRRSHRDSSTASYSSDSDSEEISRSPRKSSKSKKLVDERKGGLKNSFKKSMRKKKRSRRDSSVSNSSLDCSTCSASERRRSPVRKSKVRKKESARGRKSTRLHESSRVRVRTRSPSCSTWSPVEDRSGNSRGLSAIDDRFGGGHGHTPIVEGFESCCRQSPIGDKFQSGHAWNSIEQKCESHGQNHVDGRFESSHVQSPIEDRDWEHGGTKRLRSVLVVPNGEDGNVITACDDYPSSRSNVFCGEGNNKRDLNAEDKEKDPCNSRFREEVISSNDRLEDEGKEAADLELILRQKALENFKKFRGICHAKLETLDHKCEISGPESDQHSIFFAKMSEYKHHNSIDDQRYVQGEAHSNKFTGRSISSISADNVDENSTRILSNAQNTLSRLKRVQESSNKISSEQTSLAKDDQSKREGDQPCSVEVSGTEVGTADNPSSGACNTENQNLKLDESMVESASRSQFEEKTFSRMRDGETVQVSYKVYIPKKTPALARRKLQR